jgi:hypothetical protein
MTGMHRGSCCLALPVLVALTLPAIVAASIDLEPRDVIATGDPVPGFGRIGTGSFEALGIDERGRVLIGSELSSGEEILLLADGRRTTTLWRTGQPSGAPLRLGIQSGALSPNGRVVATALGPSPPFGSYGETSAFVEIDGSHFRRIVTIGDATPDEGVICDLGRQARINDAGAVAFEARVDEDPAACDRYESYWFAIYVVDRGVMSVAASTRSVAEEQELRLVGITRDGSVVYVVSSDLGDAPEAVLVARDAQRHCVVDLPDGCSGRYGVAVASSPSGEVVLRQHHDVDRIYRTEGGALLQVAASGEVLRGIGLVTSLEESAVLNDAGDVAIGAAWEENGVGHHGALFFPASGGPPVILPDNSAPRGINQARQIALRTYSAADGVSRWRDGSIEPLVATGDAVPGGAVFAVYGLFGAACMAEDGRVAAVATGSDYGQGIVCRDASGIHLIARHDRPAPGGGSFVNFFDCTFADGPRLYFMATTENSVAAIYAATPDGLERVIGPGDTIADGTVVENFDSSSRFAVGRDGTVVLKTAERDQLLRRRPDGTLEHVVLHTPDGRFVLRVDSFGVADGGIVVAAVELSFPRESAIVVEDARRGRVVVSQSDTTLTGGPFWGLGRILVNGQQSVFEAQDTGDHWVVFGYGLQPETISLLLPRDPSGIFPRSILDLTPSARLLYTEVVNDSGGDGWPTATYLLEEGEIQFLFRRTSLADSEPIAINDRGNVLLRADQSPLGANRHSLGLVGVDPEPICPAALDSGVDEEPPRSGADGCRIDPCGRSGAPVWLSVLAMALCGLWRRPPTATATGR